MDEESISSSWTQLVIEQQSDSIFRSMVSMLGVLKSSGCKFLRIDNQSNSNYLYDLILKDSGGKKPNIIFSIGGGTKYFNLTEQLQSEVVQGLIDITSKTDAWMLTEGLDTGISKLVGEGLSHYNLLHEDPKKIKCIGLTMWNKISRNARLDLERVSKVYFHHQQSPSKQEETKNENTIELNHSHCILFKNDQINEQSKDKYRDQFLRAACKDIGITCYTLTIMFGGDLNELETLENDIENKRPIVLIQGSGRLTDMLASLVDQTSNDSHTEHWNPNEREIQTAFDTFFPSYTYEETIQPFIRIKKILDKNLRYLLNVFSLSRGYTITQSVFNAILSGKRIGKTMENDQDLNNDSIERIRNLHETKLIDLAYDWNYLDGAKHILQRWQDQFLHEKSDENQKFFQKRENDLFQKCLENNRAKFIDFFLGAGYDPRNLTETNEQYECEQIIWNLYKQSRQSMSESHRRHVTTLFGEKSPSNKHQLYEKLQKFVGLYVGWLDTNECEKDMRNEIDLSEIIVHEEYSKEQMLRDLFLWSIFLDMSEMSKVLLVQMQSSRLCGALIGFTIFKRYSQIAVTVDLKEKFHCQALEFEAFAVDCINQCYKSNEMTACELLFRQVSLFGSVTCMQVAVSSKSEQFLQTACFDQALNLAWNSRLRLSNIHLLIKPSLIISILFFGFPAPFLMNYRQNESESTKVSIVSNKKNIYLDLSSSGLNYYVGKKSSGIYCYSKYWSRFRYFHESPVIKSCYHFMSYIWFLLVFSYMMLYRFDHGTIKESHWTELYVIITVTTMLCEEIRESIHAYNTRMLELSISSKSTLYTWIKKTWIFLPYFMFYFGLSFRFRSASDENSLTIARILLAFDLEIWYLQSLKFAMALKFLGPKLIMLQNMFRDLFAFVYIMFVAITAYGVVSRSLIYYQQVPFTAYGILRYIFYDSYWFLYGVVSDKDELDKNIQNQTDTNEAKIVATEIFLSLHMLFINILLLNLLIAVFTDTIGKVQQNTEFYWRYQRYSFVRDYFQRPILTYPPLNLLPHLILLLHAIKNKFSSYSNRNRIDENADHASLSKSWAPIFKMIAKENSSLNEYWNMFEDAATHSYARSILDEKKNTSANEENSRRKTPMTEENSEVLEGETDLSTSDTNTQQTMTYIKDELSQLKSAIIDIQQSLNTIITSQQLQRFSVSKSA